MLDPKTVSQATKNNFKMTINPEMHVRPLSDPRRFPLNFLLADEVAPIVTAGIVNPYGPTLTVIAIIKDRTSAPPALTYTYLNPFKSQLLVLGYIFEGKLEVSFTDQVMQILEPHQPFSGGAPSFSIPSPFLDQLTQTYFVAQLFKDSPGIKRLLDGFERYPLNPWNRVTEEVQHAQQSLIEGDSKSDENEAISDAELAKFVSQILNHDHCQEEIRAFLYAWSGAIDFQEKSGNLEQFPEILSGERAIELIAPIFSANNFVLAEMSQK